MKGVRGVTANAGLHEHTGRVLTDVLLPAAVGWLAALVASTVVANSYEHGTSLTLGHAHTVTFGALGLLAIGLVYMVLRHLNGEQTWSDRAGVWAFWLYNAGLVMWIALTFHPAGWPQLAAVYTHGYAYARSLNFFETATFWQWMHLPGDIVFAAGALLMAWDFRRTLRAWRGTSKAVHPPTAKTSLAQTLSR